VRLYLNEPREPSAEHPIDRLIDATPSRFAFYAKQSMSKLVFT